MTSSNNFENLNFHRIINTIGTDFFPKSFSLHWHKYIEIVAIPESAKLTRPSSLRINQITYNLHPGDLLFVWPGELHEIIENTDNQLIGLQFSTSVFNELPDFAPYLNSFRTIHHVKQSENPQLAQSMLAHIEHMISIQNDQGPFAGVETLICLYEMFIEYGTHVKNTILPNIDPSVANANQTIEKINLACNHIIENCEQELTLESVADHIGFSSCYFSRIFKQTTNYNFVEYLTLQRVKRAQSLLCDSNMSITEIAYQAGFKSISSFNRAFRQYKNCSPREYRKYYLV